MIRENRIGLVLFLVSLVEALQTRTPLVGIPFANDQRPNLLRAQRAGYAVMIDWGELTEVPRNM